MTTAEVAKILTSENNRQIWFKVQDSQLMKYILYKADLLASTVLA